MIDMIGAQQRCGDGKQRRRDNVHAMLGAKAETAVAAGRVERRCRGCIPEHGSTAGTADVDGKKDGHVSAPRATRVRCGGCALASLVRQAPCLASCVASVEASWWSELTRIDAPSCLNFFSMYS